MKRGGSATSHEKDRRIDDEELAAQHGEPVPSREALSLLSAGSSSSLLSGYEDLASSGEAPAADGTADSAAGTAGGAAARTDDATGLAGTDADASESESASVTDGDRSESFHQSDSAVSET